ncbi:MAG: WD40 repeat domain-containing protein [Rubripirellula sp.]
MGRDIDEGCDAMTVVNRKKCGTIWWNLCLCVAFTSVVSKCGAATPPYTDLAITADGQALIATSQMGAHVVSWSDLKQQKVIAASFTNLHCVAFSPSGEYFVLGGGNPAEEGGIQVFSWPECTPLMTLTGHEDSVMAVAWVGDHQVVSAGLDRLLNTWDIRTKKLIRSYRGHSRGITAVCYLPTQNLVSGSHDVSVRVWGLESTSAVRTLNQHSQPIHSIAVSPLESAHPVVATAANDRTIRFWQPTIGRMMRYIRLESEPLDVAWMDERYLIASCVDGIARCIDSTNVKVVGEEPGVEGWAYAVAVHPQERICVLAGSEGVIRKIEFSE